jgi:glyoxylase-like metal-dependent hydrolase (beta-lactamase superfamily II)
MSWSSSIVSPPDGDMAAYFDSLKLLLDRQDALYLPGHGPPLPAPQELVRNLLAHRQMREAAILDALAAAGATDIVSLREQLYSQTDEWLRRAAERNVLAHLLKLQAEGKVRQAGDIWATA